MRKFLSNETVIKIFSILAAIIMWMYVMNEQNPYVPYVIRDVPVKLVNLDQEKFAIKNGTEKFKVNVKVRGRRSLITELKPEDINAEVNLRGRMEGDNLLRVDVTVPPNTEFIDVSPKEIMVVLDSIVEEQLPITVDVVGRPARGFAAAKPISIKPQAVVVKGPISMVNAIKHVSTKIDITDKTSDANSILPVRVLNAQNKEQEGITFRPDVVEVTVPIVPVKEIPITPNLVGDPPEGFTVTNVKVVPHSVTVTGESELLNSLGNIGTNVINIDGKSTSLTRDVEMVWPQGISPLDNEMEKTVRVIVDIERIISTALNFSAREIELRNAEEGLLGELENKDVVLTVRGPESIIDKVNKSIVNIFVDISGLGEGEHSVKVIAEVLEPYDIVRIEPEEVKVILRSL